MPADAGDGQRAGFVLALAQRRARRCVGERWILGGIWSVLASRVGGRLKRRHDGVD